MHHINRLSDLHKALFISLIASALFAIIAFGAQLSPSVATPLAGVVIEDTLAGSSRQGPIKPGDLEQQLGWTAWSG